MTIVAKTPLPVIISGTGPAALLFAHALLRATPPLPFRLYERDLSMTHRAQGYRFGVSGRGVRSCREVLSPDHFALLRATCGDNHTVFPKRFDALTGAALPGFPMPLNAKKSQKEDQTLKADRTLMRQVLFKGLEGYTTFGKEIVSYEDASAGNSHATNGSGDSPDVLVRFADGSTVRGSLLVGADGSFSRVRTQLQPEVQSVDSELRMVCGKTPLTPAFYAAMGTSGADDPRTAELLEGLAFVAESTPQESPMFFMFDPMRFGGRASAAAADPDTAACIPSDYIYWALALRSDRSEVQGLDWRMDGSAAADLAEDLTKSFSPSLRAIVQHQDRTQTMPLISVITPTPLQDWRDPTTASHSPMVTLIGDAAHAMPPTSGRGAVTALTDAAVLGEALATHGVSRHALEAYEAEMRDYATQAIDFGLEYGKRLINMRNLEELKPLGY